MKKKSKELVPPLVMPEDFKTDLPTINQSKIYQMFLQGRNEDICEIIIKVLGFYELHNYKNFSPKGIQKIDDFISIVFALMVNSNFTIPNNWCMRLISMSHIFANLVRISSYKSTDPILSHILKQENNYVKILFLYSVLNKVQVPIKQLFDVNTHFASMWYFTYGLPSVGRVTPLIQENFVRHMTEIDERYVLNDHRVTPLYFACSYMDGRADRKVKETINKECQRISKNTRINNIPDKNSIAIVTSKWFANSAVHKSSSPLVERLRKKYGLTLIHLGQKEPKNLITEPFEEIHYLKFNRESVLNTDSIENNNFQLVYYPDIGMNDESVWLSNLRLAPIQVTSYGHPISTFGSKIDYFIAGQESEVHVDLKKNYSERVVLIPGIGAHPSWPNYEPKFPEKKSNKVIINCVWGPEKWNYTILAALEKIARETKTPLEFQFFTSPGINRYQSYIPFERDVKELLGDYAVIHANKEYYKYMEEAEYADFSLNSWPFGGYNTVVESLYLGKPVITLEGDKFCNRAGACLLRKVGLGDLVVPTMRDFIILTKRMVNDADFRGEVCQRLKEIDLRACLFDTNEPEYFERAIDYLIENHEQLKDSREPIVIQ